MRKFGIAVALMTAVAGMNVIYGRNIIQSGSLDVELFTSKLIEGKGGPYSKISGDVSNNIKLKLYIRKSKIENFEYICSALKIDDSEKRMLFWYINRLNSAQTFKGKKNTTQEILIVLEQDKFEIFGKRK